MSHAEFVAFWSGAITMGFLIGSLFFIRFWRRTGDRLFLAFAAAFGLLAVNQATPVVVGVTEDALSGIYLLRLAAFLLIIFAILRKNFGSG
jgi:hypothetical protein